VLSYIGLGDKAPKQSPGRDYSRVLRGEKTEWDDVMFYEMELTRAIRTEDWKYVARHPDGPFELYDMKADPQERFNLFGQPRHKQIQRALAARLAEFFKKHADPQYDVWKGGRSKAGPLK
jgi:arylsulfatase A-like enzyme